MKNKFHYFIDVYRHNNFSNLSTIKEPFYYIIIFEGDLSFSINGYHYTCNGKSIIFLTPYQLFKWKKTNLKILYFLRFHGDFYCIEYHKKEVSCNGILFNNIYENPYISLTNPLFKEIIFLLKKIKTLETKTESYNQSILKSYLQLILALSSKEKQVYQNLESSNNENCLCNFQILLEKNFSREKSVAFYAENFNLSIEGFSKKIKKKYGRAPSILIQERIILEAKKKLHLTNRTIKEISNELGFEDSFYFSRFFKKHVNVSPKKFRENVGISIVSKNKEP